MTLKKTNQMRNLLLFLQDKTRDYENKIALATRSAYGWKEFTYKGIGLLSRKIASWMIYDIKLGKGDRVATLCESKPEFGACFFASALSSTIFTPLDVKLTLHELRIILTDCKPKILFVSNQYFEQALILKNELDFIKHVVLIDECPIKSNFTTIYNLSNNFDVKFRRPHLRSTAILIYTSGTTGAPKGVEISYLNMVTQLESLEWVKDVIFPEYGKTEISVLSILPMNHLFELTVGFSLFMKWGFSIYYTNSLKPNDILSIMREKNVKFMIVVPAFLKLLKSSIENKINSGTKIKRFFFKVAYNISKFLPSTKIKIVIFKDIHKSFGGSFKGCITGGAPLDINVGKFFENIGIEIYNGYGLTETSPVVSVNCHNRKNLASVGKPLKCFDAMIDSQTGELLLRGLSVMKGYYGRDDLTKQVIDEHGWLHTGDIARIDKKGFIYITGRIKSMIVLSGGKKVFPEEIEMVLQNSALFKEICVFGYSKTQGAKEGCEEVAVAILPKDEIKNNVNYENLIKSEVKRMSLQLASYKRPTKIFILNEPLPRTTTRKVKRNKLKELLNY